MPTGSPRRPADEQGDDCVHTGGRTLARDTGETGGTGASRGTRLTGEARTFAPDELIVSETDLRGVVTHADDVSLQVSATGWTP